MKRIFTLLLLPICTGAFAQKLGPLSIEKIMRDPKWIGVAPSNIRWSDDSKKIYFNWNPENADRDQLFAITPIKHKPEKVSIDAQKALIPEYGEWNKKRTIKLFEKNGDIWLSDLKTGKIQQLTNTVDRESSATFSGDESKVIFQRGENLYSLKINGGELVQLTNFTHGASATPAPAAGRRGGGARRGAADVATGNDQERWLKAEQLELFDIIKVKNKDRKLDSAERKNFEVKKLKEIAVDDKSVGSVAVSPDGRYITYRLAKYPEGVKSAIVPDYVTASGFTEDIPNRTKVGGPQTTYESFVFDTQKDTTYKIVTSAIPGIKDLPDYVKDYPKELERRTKANLDRQVEIRGPFWSEDGKNAIVEVSAQDNKDKWIMKLDPATGALSVMDREHDDAWVGGPGQGNVGFTDNTHFYFESENSGYAHIYLLDVTTGAKKTADHREIRGADPAALQR